MRAITIYFILLAILPVLYIGAVRNATAEFLNKLQAQNVSYDIPQHMRIIFGIIGISVYVMQRSFAMRLQEEHGHLKREETNSTEKEATNTDA